MTPVLQFGNQTITAAEALKLLAGYQMLPQLCRFLIIDQAITSLSSANAPILLLSEEKTSAIEQYYENNQLTTPAQREAWLKHYGMSGEQLESLATRELRIEKFKQAIWGSKVESYFLQYKPQLDKVVYSLLRTSDAEAAQELYFRIKAGEQTFAECASLYSQGQEAQTGGLVGPVGLSQPHPAIAQKLAISQPGQLWPPMQLENWVVIIRLEKLIPAQLDDATRITLLNHLFETWLTEELNNTQISLTTDAPTPSLVTQ
ncbi:peptidylprolyl isomerase [Chlorogloeopsis sp. ULAP01]|uniref:peptidylprolyl isomerase n=1 Tax=Chlorogloeopsis sp. ULAP01 TaxID=3056483 RepID=UPI0025AAB313|nr:peptidylprolyl isomerase [Chlorogloeopsis sp. ULAP01]MDM9384720.1 peptidylprolyl isomerase [Chlorogloeopsis sp. ULAP01]